MPVLLFKLNGVPEDEADDIRVLLRQNHIDFYETSAGNWQISLAAIWLNDSDRFDQARKLIEEYQIERTEKAQQLYKQSAGAGINLSFPARVRREPLRHLLYLVVILVVIYFSTIPFFNFHAWLH
jgi:hypothetical protein